MNVTAVPKVEVYTRHSADCPKASSRSWKRCGCPKWLYWRQDGKALLQSAKTRSWEKAQEVATEIEERFRLALQGKDVELPCGMTVKEAVRLYLEDKREQHSGGTLLSKLTRLLEAPSPKGNKEAKTGELPVEDREVKPGEVLGFAKWCATKQTPAIKDVPLPVSHIASVTVRHLEEFRKSWPGAPLTKKKKQELLRAFFNFCLNHGWVRTNQAKLLSPIRVDEVPTDYFPPEEFAKILSAIETYPTKSKQPSLRRARVKAVALLMRWSGLRAGDAIKLERMRLNENKLLLRMEKTGTPVSCLIPPDVADLLRDTENSNPAYFFWSGNGSADSVYSDWHRTFEKVFAEANLGKRCHFHMFRDTFAVERLLAGVPIEQVSRLLGHKSIRVTEKHYSPWVQARQEQLEASVQKAWAVQ
jgi:integrase